MMLDLTETGAMPAGQDPESLAGAVDLLVNIGCLLIQHGAHAGYVENSLQRLRSGLDIERIDSVVLLKAILITAARHDTRYTRVVRVPVVIVNLNLLSEVEKLLQRFEPGGMSAGELAAELERIAALPPHYSRRVNLAAVGLGCAAFCHLFGGDPAAMAVTGVAATVAAWVRIMLNHWQINYFLVVLLTALTASLLAGNAIWISQTLQSALTAAVILLVPGTPLINASIDLLHGHIFSGMARIMISLVIFLGIAVGLGIAVQVLRVSL